MPQKAVKLKAILVSNMPAKQTVFGGIVFKFGWAVRSLGFLLNSCIQTHASDGYEYEHPN